MTSWRTALVLLVTALTVPAAAFAAFVAVVEWSGCFLSCDGSPDRPLGGALALLAVALLLAGPSLGWRLLRGAGIAVAGTGLLLGTGLVVALVGV